MPSVCVRFFVCALSGVCNGKGWEGRHQMGRQRSAPPPDSLGILQGAVPCLLCRALYFLTLHSAAAPSSPWLVKKALATIKLLKKRTFGFSSVLSSASCGRMLTSSYSPVE